MKNQGYHLEHNYGHGSKNLSYNFYILTLLAFYFHQIFELTDKLYKLCRKKYVNKLSMWQSLRVYIDLFVFDTWEMLLEVALGLDDYELSQKSPP